MYMNDKILSMMPPVRIICGSSDPLRDDSVLFTKKLCDLNKDVKYIELKYFPHGFLNYDFPLMMPEASVGSEIIMEEMEKFINKKKDHISH
jgi:hormone-sensitive lipase